MSAYIRLGNAGIIAAGAVWAVTLALIAKYIRANVPRNVPRILASFFALVNPKNIPGFWHIRILRAILYQVHIQPTPLQPRDLFKPLITSSSNTLYDCDYKWHKSNSTYFSDFDVARAHIITCVIHTGMIRLNDGDEEGLPQSIVQTLGEYTISLGGVSCFFHRQIEPLQHFDIHTRILSWDRKWLYCVSHVVRKGAIKPIKYVLQPWKKGKLRAADVKQDEEDLTRHVFASSIARYIFKKARLTINPEIVLERSRLLPRRPEGIGLPLRAEKSIDTMPTEAPTAVPEIVQRRCAVADQASAGEDNWSLEDMDCERL